MPLTAKPKLTHNLFWDVDHAHLDYDNYYRFVIERVLERGDMCDWREIKRYYGLEKIKEAVLQARWLSNKTWHFCSAIFDIPLEKFRCYTFRQLAPKDYPF